MSRSFASRALNSDADIQIRLDNLGCMTYEVGDGIARITLNRPSRGNGITFRLPQELSYCVEQANLDPSVKVIALSGNGRGFCGGYDLVQSAENMAEEEAAEGGKLGAIADTIEGSPLDLNVVGANHNPKQNWDPMVDYQMMSRNVKGFMSLFHSDKPTVCKVHGFCIAGGTDMALCSDLLVVEDAARIGYPPARVWGTPTTALWVNRIGAQRAKRLLLTGDCISGKTAAEWGLALTAVPAAELDEVFDALLTRIARMPLNQLIMQKAVCNAPVINSGLHMNQAMSVVFDGISRHTDEGYAFQQQAAATGFKNAVRERDDAFADEGDYLGKDRDDVNRKSRL